MISNWARPNWEELTPEAKADFRCGVCNNLTPWQEQWDSVLTNVCSICDSCKADREEEHGS